MYYNMKEDKTFVNNIIKIGQNKHENDTLVKESKQTDLWFHLANLPSCHVILESDNVNQATIEMIVYAAQLTKQNTKYRDHSKTIVNYAPTTSAATSSSAPAAASPASSRGAGVPR